MGICPKCGHADNKMHTPLGDCLCQVLPGYPLKAVLTTGAVTREIHPTAVDTMVANFIETLGNLDAIMGPSFSTPEEIACAIDLIGKRLRQECYGGKLRFHAMLAKQILTIATTSDSAR